MNQVLLYSIQPQHLINILNGLKTIEVRKRDLPQWAKDKLARGENVVGYGYCTKGGQQLYDFGKLINQGTIFQARVGQKRLLNGLVVVKFEVSGTTKYVDCSDCTNTENGYECQNDFRYLLSVDPVLRKETCLTSDEIEEYGNGANLYAHHLTNITPIEPMGLGEFMKEEYAVMPNGIFPSFQPLTKATQSFMTCWVKGE